MSSVEFLVELGVNFGVHVDIAWRFRRKGAFCLFLHICRNICIVEVWYVAAAANDGYGSRCARFVKHTLPIFALAGLGFGWHAWLHQCILSRGGRRKPGTRLLALRVVDGEGAPIHHVPLIGFHFGLASVEHRRNGHASVV